MGYKNEMAWWSLMVRYEWWTGSIKNVGVFDYTNRNLQCYWKGVVLKSGNSAQMFTMNLKGGTPRTTYIGMFN